jgi:hypothetical protein
LVAALAEFLAAEGLVCAQLAPVANIKKATMGSKWNRFMT